jgi:hypothetical protein
LRCAGGRGPLEHERDAFLANMAKKRTGSAAKLLQHHSDGALRDVIHSGA